MTGQNLSGTDPVTAVKYQIAIMGAIAGSVAVTAFLIVLQGYSRYFTPAHQLRDLRCDQTASPPTAGNTAHDRIKFFQ
jgi:ABC-type iron transport system FetAB permease component